MGDGQLVRLDERSGDVGLQRVAAGWLLSFGSPNTRSAYRFDLEEWARWCSSHGTELLEVARAEVDAYARMLEEAGRSPATVARKLASLASFYRYAQAEGLVTRSPVAFVRRPRVAQASPSLGLDRVQLVAFLDAARAASPRDHALACLLALNGLRVSEVCAATVKDLGDERAHRVLTIRRKGGTTARIALAPITVAAIGSHLQDRDSGPLFLDNAGEPLDRHDAARVVRRLARRADLPRISPHSLRHTFVTLAREAGVPLEDVQDAAGHADPRTTRRYDRGRHNLDRSPTYTLSAFVAGADNQEGSP